MQPFELLEFEIGKWCGRPNVACCNSGTSALHLALESLGLPLGSAVALPTWTMIACARAVSLAGLVPVFVDCTDNLLMDLDALDLALADQGNVRAIMAVHIYGRRCDMDGIHALASKYGVPVIEDLAEIHGVHPHPFTYAACHSYYMNKVVAGEEGGSVAFLEPEPAAKVRCLRSMGFSKRHDFFHVPRGHNYRLANALAVPILGSLATIETNIVCRRKIEEAYDWHCPPEWKMPRRDVPWVYDLRIPGLDIGGQFELVSLLNSEKIAARHGFKSMHHQEEYRQFPIYATTDTARADVLSKEVLYLPIVPGVTTGEECRRAMEIIQSVPS